MTPIEAIKQRCHIDSITGCWLWRGGIIKGASGTKVPRVYSVDYTADPTGQTKRVQTGNRAVWHAVTGKPIPDGHKVYKAHCCTNGLCLNFDHMACGDTATWGATVSAKGHLKGRSNRILANRATGRARSKVTPAMVLDLLASEETCIQAAARLGLTKSVVSNVRTGRLVSVTAAGNPFAGLMT